VCAVIIGENVLMKGYEAAVEDGSAVIIEGSVGARTVAAIPNVLLRDVLGAGANGVVFRGEDRLGRPVGVKIWPPRLHPERSVARAQEQALEEARKVATLKHESIATVYTVDRLPNGWPYTVSEYMQGDVLRDVRDSLSPGIRQVVVMSVLQTLRYAEESGVLHGDLHDGNVVLERFMDVPMKAHVIDFGTSAFAKPGASELRHARMLREFVWQYWPELDDYLRPLPTLARYRGADMLPVLSHAVNFVTMVEMDRRPRLVPKIDVLSSREEEKTDPSILGFHLAGMLDFDLNLIFERLAETYSSRELVVLRQYFRASLEPLAQHSGDQSAVGAELHVLLEERGVVLDDKWLGPEDDA
jgi:serine/threonine protein kinase